MGLLYHYLLYEQENKAATAHTECRYDGNRTAITVTDNKLTLAQKNFTQDVTSAVQALHDAGQDYIIFQWTASLSYSYLRGKGHANAPTLVIVTADASTTTSYTVNYLDNGGNVLKTATEHAGITIGSTATATAEEMASFTVGSQKYIYSSGNAEITLASDAASNVINLTFREAETYNYTVNAVDGSANILRQITTGSVNEGDNASFYLPVCVLVNGTLHFMAAEDSYKSVAVANDNTIFPYAYTTSSVDNVVFFVEGENISGASTSTPTNNQRLASKGYMGRGSNLAVTTLPAGVYTIYLHYINTNSGGHSVLVKAGAKEVINTSLSDRSTTNGTVVLTDETTITLTATGSSTSGVDYIYITQIPSVSSTIGSTGYTTFASEYPLNLDNLPTGLTAYYIISTGVGTNYVTLTEATGTVQAGTGLLLAGTAGSYDIPVAASGSALDGNLLVGCTTATNVAAANKKYVLVANGGAAEFQSLEEHPATIPAGKAYLDVSSVGGASKARLSLLFDGEATSIAAPEVAEAEDDAPAYNVAGQRVAAGYRGIVIKGGKKYLQK